METQNSFCNFPLEIKQRDMMMRHVNPKCETLTRDMTESRRALELRKFFSPYQFSKPESKEGFNESLNNDGALDAYVETVVWRLHGKHAMVSLIDRDTQYFLAGSLRTAGDEDLIQDGKWFGCSTVPTPGGLCENTLALDDPKIEYPVFIVSDLSKDERFANLPVVNGSVASYKFYAGVPITTMRGVNIGSLFLFDDKPRDTMPLDHKKFLHSQAGNIMKHLQSKREAAERRRVTLMSKGIATFLEKASEASSNQASSEFEETTKGAGNGKFQAKAEDSGTQTLPDPTAKESILDKIRLTLDFAAEILKESLELTVGGVVFLDPTESDYSDNGNTDAYSDSYTDLGKKVQELEENSQRKRPSPTTYPLSPLLSSTDDEFGGRKLSQSAVRSSDDKHKPAKILSMSAAKIAAWDPEATVLDSKTLQTFIKSYPKGNVWYMDKEGYFSSLDQHQSQEKGLATSPTGRNRSISPSYATKQAAEAAMLGTIFKKARQIIFLPLWDAGGDRWYAGCFVWSLSAVPVFSVDNEISYLSSFTNSVMVEINRLDAITANKVKGDFISSISHEFRSPLHGILASAEFLRDSTLDISQLELISTIQTCGNTLLDTINHVLDYSKINTFEKSEKSLESYSDLFQVTDLALLFEQIISGMIAANEYRGPATNSTPASERMLDPYQPQSYLEKRNPLAIIIDIESRRWEFKVQAGALKRIVMNIFGNAQKYTDSGYIMVRLRVQNASRTNSAGKITGKNLCLRIRDSGRGMSSEYMERKLYQPFAQEDSFAPGVGLGLSIVWSIVNSLGGKIQVRSETGKGTDIEVTLPLEESQDTEELYSPSNPVGLSDDARKSIATLRERAQGMSVRIYRTPGTSIRHEDVFWGCVERYCSDWFGFQVNPPLPSESDLVITNELDPAKHSCTRVLYVHKGMVCQAHQDRGEQASRDISCPVGPFKLAKAILSILDHDPSCEPSSSGRDVGTQTPLGSTEERLVLDGVKLTDYGFPQRPIVVESPVENGVKVILDGETPVVSGEAVSTMNCVTLTLPPKHQLDADSNKILRAPVVVPKIVNPILAASKTPPTGLHILAVDDNAVNLQLLKRYLQKRKMDTIATARNGLEAVEVFRYALNSPEGGLRKFDIIFMDISMPEMDGFEATRVIRRLEGELSEDEGGRAYVVALTGLASRKDRDLAVECGLDDFLTKPVSFVKIGEVLKRIAGAKEAGE